MTNRERDLLKAALRVSRAFEDGSTSMASVAYAERALDGLNMSISAYTKEWKTLQQEVDREDECDERS